MKSFLIIGMGTMGHHLCHEFCSSGNDVMVVDKESANVEDVLDDVVSAKVCDCTRREVLKSFGISDFDACFVCVGKNFQDCLEITDLLHDLGAQKIFSSVDRDIEEKFLLRNGADEVIYPERDTARRISGRVNSRNIFDCISLSQEYSIYEIEPLKQWIGKSLIDLDVRNRFKLNVIAVKKDGKIIPEVYGDYVFNQEEHILVIGHMNDIKKVLK